MKEAPGIGILYAEDNIELLTRVHVAALARHATGSRQPQGRTARLAADQDPRSDYGRDRRSWVSTHHRDERYSPGSGRTAEDTLDLRTGVIPTNRPCIREDRPDQLFLTTQQRDATTAAEVCAAHERGQPVLTGTSSVADSLASVRILADSGVTAAALNGKNDAEEAATIGRADKYGTAIVSHRWLHAASTYDSARAWLSWADYS